MSRRYHSALPKKWHGLARVFSALGDEQRQRILLMFERGDELTIKDVFEACPLSRTAVTHHLRVLREAGVLTAEKRGKEVFLKPEPKAVTEALDRLREYIEEELE
jgi:ArsR family transcriptional regulator, arsenate/arsenite/antimonite-responsive transcriptional repressor